ncbi:hypothetical protein C8R42DRAFT_576765, partial [Lentinula raphanica]
DEGKEFRAGYALAKTDHLSARNPVADKSDWNRAFDTWKHGVIQAYPHRKDELFNDGLGISNLFRNFAHDPLIPICTDHEVRERYHKSSFRLDDNNHAQAAVMALIHRPSMGARSKCPLDSDSSDRSSKQCDDPCINGRRHGTCSIRGGKHRAFDSAECKPEFRTRRSWNTADRESSAESPSRT